MINKIKKLTGIFLTIFILACMPVRGNNTNYIKHCPQITPKSGITPSKIIGMKWVSEKIAQGIIGHELKKETKGKFKVKIQSRSTSDLISGTFQSLSINGKNLNIDGSHISKLTSNTLCGYNSVDYNKKPAIFRENMVLNYEVQIDNNALAQTLIDTGYTASVKKLFPVNDAKIEIRNNKLYFIFQIPTYVTKPIQLTISSKLNVKNGRINLTSIQVPKNNIINTQRLVNAIEKTNPFSFNSAIMDNNSKISIDSVNIVNDIIVVKGLVLIPKSTES